MEKGFAEADHIVEGRYQTSPIEHAPTETTACIVKPEPDGRFTVYTNTQALYFTLDNTALILQMPFKKLHFVGGTVGGGFGGKVDVIVEPIAILAAMKTGRPVKYKFSREEEMRASSTRGAWRMYFKDGVMKDGRIVARKVTTYADSGAYNRHTPYAVTKHAANVAGPYNIPNVWIDAYCVYTNRQPGSAMRGFRRDAGLLRPRGADGQDRRDGRPRSVGDSLHQRLSQRRYEAAPEGGRRCHADRGDAGGGGDGGPRACRRSSSG